MRSELGPAQGMSATVTILTGNHLCNNPRVMKEASAMARAGHTVRVLGAWTDAGLKARDLELLAGMPFVFVPVINLVGVSPGVRTRRLVLRAISRVSKLACAWFRAESRFQLGPAAWALARAGRREVADLCVAHSEAALLAVRYLARSGRRVGVDMEDWYSEDLLPEARRPRPINMLRSLERELLRAAVHATCPSRAMSDTLAKEFDCPLPTVIYNAFPLSERAAIDGQRKDRRRHDCPSIHWFSQTLGEGRGLEELMAALALIISDGEVHLRGTPAPGFQDWLAARTPDRWRDRIVFHPVVANQELLSRIAEHDIGFAGEASGVRSRNLTITNKILHYLLGGLAVVASDTAGQREVAERAGGAVQLYRCSDPAALAAQLEPLLTRPHLLQAAKFAALRAATETFSWEKQEAVLIDGVRRALGTVNR